MIELMNYSCISKVLKEWKKNFFYQVYKTFWHCYTVYKRERERERERINKEINLIVIHCLIR
jgi:hypothetical protein